MVPKVRGRPVLSKKALTKRDVLSDVPPSSKPMRCKRGINIIKPTPSVRPRRTTIVK